MVEKVRPSKVIRRRPIESAQIELDSGQNELVNN